MKIVTIVGARPQFIKAWPVSQALREAGHEEFLVHTGQHYDYAMSRVFFDELDIPDPHINLEVGSGTQGHQTALMLEKIEAVLLKEDPDWVLVYGDTNSTLAGALAAAKLNVPTAHVEAGLRSFNRRMPEEINRVLTDHVSDLLFCPTKTAVRNLQDEGVVRGVHHVGDVMYDVALRFGRLAEQRATILTDLDLRPGGYYLVTVHRAENTDDPRRLAGIMYGLDRLATREAPVVFPIHPRTRAALERLREFQGTGPLSPDGQVRLINPVSFLNMIQLEKHARTILTDSGGVQKEAYFHGVPCVTLREETEWTETVANGWNQLVGSDPDAIEAAVASAGKGHPIDDFGNGDSARRVVELFSGCKPHVLLDSSLA